jgi:hypothetical protein
MRNGTKKLITFNEDFFEESKFSQNQTELK